MSLNAINTATAGLQAMQAQIGVVSQNIANVNTVGYVKRVQSSVAQNDGTGINSGDVSRILNATSQKQLRLESSGAAYTSIAANVGTQLDALYGVPGSSTSLDGVLNGYTQSLQALANDPTVSSVRATVASNAATLASRIGTIANGIQTLRTGMESQIASDVKSAGSLLRSIAQLNVKIVAANGIGASPDLLDQRDQAINQLAQYMDVQATQVGDGSITVMTQSGVTLVDHGVSASLGFDSRAVLSPEALYSTEAGKSGVGTITATTPGGARIDLIATGALRSGSLAAAVTARDDTLVQAQRQIDELAAGLAQSTTDRTVSAAASTGIDLNGLKAGNRITLGLANGSQIVLVASDTGTATFRTGDIDGSAPIAFRMPGAQPIGTINGDATLAANITAALQPNYVASVTAGKLTIALGTTPVAGTASVTTLGATLTIPSAASETKAPSNNPEIALFVDSGRANGLYTGNFDGGSQLTGFAQRIALNPAIKGDTSALVLSSATTQSGDATRPQRILDGLITRPYTFSAASGIGGVRAPFTTNVADFTLRIIDAQGANAASSQSLDEGQQIALATAQSRFSSESGVKIDEEMANLIQLQTAYGANARVLTAARDMLDTLLRI
ncbi:flagellar biosynthesis protein FlgK [Methylobacterium sp. Leaf469]|uniref:flagellar hook-associated protein FlgK n=1 Tax=Methylobacterium sp. Leaf469 TaxID=1736387 RepID=UPI0006F508ED|nr:flagellar hook-associated protein FlgK [Methylobacterium sp. Leaf469]KQT95344.1 flagellar biosynthesis protein FlgK [Methylobacterium sp. Leaf469]